MSSEKSIRLSFHRLSNCGPVTAHCVKEPKSKLVQVIPRCLPTPNHYMKQRWASSVRSGADTKNSLFGRDFVTFVLWLRTTVLSVRNCHQRRVPTFIGFTHESNRILIARVNTIIKSLVCFVQNRYGVGIWCIDHSVWRKNVMHLFWTWKNVLRANIKSYYYLIANEAGGCVIKI